MASQWLGLEKSFLNGGYHMAEKRNFRDGLLQIQYYIREHCY